MHSAAADPAHTSPACLFIVSPQFTVSNSTRTVNTVVDVCMQSLFETSCDRQGVHFDSERERDGVSYDSAVYLAISIQSDQFQVPT